MPAPYDYSLGNVSSPAQSFLQGLQTFDVLQKREQDIAAKEAAQQAAQQRQALMAEFQAKAAAGKLQSTDFDRLTLLDPANYKAWSERAAQLSTEKKDSAFNTLSPVYAALYNQQPDVAKARLQTELVAAENAQDASRASQIKAALQLIETPEGQQAALLDVGTTMFGLNPDRMKSLQESLNTQGTAGATRRKAEAEAREAEIKLQRLDAMQEAELRKATSAADEQEIKAKFAERREKAELALKKAQAAQASQATANLTEQGKLLKLDFEAATKGLPLPSKGGGTTTVGAATEDERKAAGWLAQATNAYDNMLKSMYTKEGKPTGAEKPGLIESVAVEPLKGFARSAERQQFVQASSSLSEALLRAATGAGVNKDEAAQKVAELTPTYSDSEETRKQKLAAIPMYLRSLQERAGRAAPKNYQVPTAQNLNITVDY
jgi:hypothetical protein